jgi:nitrogen fixation/metabolism regulation signal transduction histidine kinase
MDLFQAEPSPGTVEPGELINEVLDRLKEEETNGNVLVDISINQRASLLKGDRQELMHLFYYLLQNSMEAVGSDNPRVVITSELDFDSPHYLRIEIFNTGEPPRRKLNRCFPPSFQQSSREQGLGFL